MIEIVFITIYIPNVILHGVGLYLLIRLYRRGERSPQRLFLMNLSLCEMFRNILAVMYQLMDIMLLTKKIPANPQTYLFMESIQYIGNTSVHYLFISAMFALIGDRLLCIILGIRYPSIWTIRKTAILLSCIWSFNLLVSIAVVVCTYHKTYLTYQTYLTVFNVLVFYVPTANLTIFLLLAVTAYFIMFNKFYSSFRVTRSTNQSNQSRLHAFRKSKFFISIMLLTSFLILLVIPYLSSSILILAGKPLPTPYSIYGHISFIASDFVDGLIYIFLQPSVKKLFVETFCWWCCTGNCCSGCRVTLQSSPEGNISVVERRRNTDNEQQKSGLDQSVDVASNPRGVIMTSTRL